MKLLLLSLLPLAADLAVARPALQEDSTALARRLAPLPEPQERPEDAESEKPITDDSTWIFSDPHDLDYSDDLPVNFDTISSGRFLGLDNDEIAELPRISIDGKQDFDVAIRPGLKLDDKYDFTSAFLGGDADTPDFVKQDPKGTNDNKDGKGDYKTIPPPVVLGTPTFDPGVTDFFDNNGLPVVAFNANDDYSTTANLNLPPPAVSLSPSAVYSPFVPPPSPAQ